MAMNPNKVLNHMKDIAKAEAGKVDVEKLKQRAAEAGEFVAQKAVEVKDAAVIAKEDITEKLTELDRMLESSITEYNDAYTLMNDKGVQLYMERCRSVDSVTLVENLVNSIANTPKSFASDFEEIEVEKNSFLGACDYAERELQAARTAAGGAGAGLAAGASVAFMAPTAAMWVATTFGTASTGTAIASLSGAAATNAALAWLGGGGMAAGQALLALAGPVGWTIAGATLLTSILLFTTKKTKLNKQKNEEIEAVKRNTEKIKEMDAQIGSLLSTTITLRDALNASAMGCMGLFGKDYTQFSSEDKIKIGALVNSTKALSALFKKTIGAEEQKNAE